ncbi:MAG: relaxase/mobilization nuclease domain-containing protein [Cyclobacteriaceae bacterium]|jgi:hypothetical protein|tara:strand:- start:57582 stop:58985 length:1404 start_codon:yes stop_codon:yes gene_type:complete
MIAKILKNYSYHNIGDAIEYHEEKVKKNVASKDYIIATIPMEDALSISRSMTAHMELNNPNKRGSHFHHISVNFPVEDKVELVTKRKIILEYLEGMGYDQTLRCAYRHQDKAHDHWHVFVTASDSQGKLIPTRDDYFKSTRMSRRLEKEYGLRSLSERSTGHSIDNNPDNFCYAKAIEHYQKLLLENDQTADPAFDLAIEANADRMTNEEIRNLYKSRNRSADFQSMIRLLTKADLIALSRKAEMQKRASIIKSESSSVQEFIEKFNDEGLGYYARFLANQKDITYGYQSLFMKGAKLDPQYSWHELTKYWNKERDRGEDLESLTHTHTDFEFNAVKAHVKSRVHRNINYSESWEDLISRLDKERIEIKLTMRKDGNTSLVFYHMDYKIKSSALNLTYQQIIKKINTLQKEEKEFLSRINRSQIRNSRSSVNKMLLTKSMAKVKSGTQRAADEEENKQRWKYQGPDQ